MDMYVDYDAFNLLTLILGIVSLGWLLNLLWSRRKLYIYSWSVPGPLALPLVGHAYLLLGYDKTEKFKMLQRGTKKYREGILKIWAGPKLYYNIVKPEYIEKILSSPKILEKDDAFHIVRESLGNGILSSPVKLWKPRRKAIAPCMNQNVLNSYVYIFSRNSLHFIEKLKGLTGRKDLDWGVLGTRYTLEVFGNAAMGVEINIVDKEPSDGDLGVCLRHIIDIATYRYTTLPYHINTLWQLAPIKRTYDRYIKRFDEIINSYIKEKMDRYKNEQTLEIRESRQIDFLDLLLQDTNFSHDEIVDEVKTMMAAAADTTGLLMFVVCMMLAIYPDVQQKVYEEAINVLGHDRGVEVADVPLLKYTERVIKETLRLYPAVVVLARKVTEDFDLGEYVLPEGSNVSIFPSLVHRNSEYWTDPLKFDPDRFLPEEVAKRHPCTYIPFSQGARNCIGWQYGLMNMKTVVALLIRELIPFSDYKSVEEIQVIPDAVLSFKDGIKLRFEPRVKTY